MYKRVNFKTEDDVIISGDYYGVPEPKGYVLMLHMMPAVKESWQELAKAMNRASFAVLAIDLRGHGESINKTDGTTLNYKNFTDQQHQSSIYDVKAALNWLRMEGAMNHCVAVVGASIGANLALYTLANVKEIPTAVLMSPGLDFRGLQTEPLVKKLKQTKSFLCISSLDDKYSFDSCRTLIQETPLGIQKENIELQDAGHGTHMFSTEPDLAQKVVAWIESHLN